jgi:hypothetical protein
VVPHIADLVPAGSAMQTAAAVTVTTKAVTERTTEAAAKMISITFANITRTGHGTRVGVLCAVPRGHMALASHSGSCEHSCGDQCSRQKFKLRHSMLPFDMSQQLLAPLYKW